MATNRPGALQVYDPVLSNLARMYRPVGFIADQLVADIPVSTLSGQYPVFTEDFWFQNDVDTLIVDRAPSKEVDFEWSTDTYLCEEHGLKVSITELERQQAISQLRLERNKTEFLAHRMRLAKEIRVAALLNTQDNGGGLDNTMDNTPSVNWDQATATIEDDIKGGVLAVYDAIGLAPNTIVIPYKVAYAMAVQEDIRAILANQMSGSNPSFLELGSRVLPGVIHGMKVIVPMGAQKNPNREGGATSRSEIWSDDVRLLYVDQNAEWGIPSVAYRFVHTRPRVTRWSIVDPDVDYVRQMERFDEKIVADKAGYVLHSVLS